LIISSLALTALRIGFQANFARIRKNNPKMSVVQKIVPIAGVVRLFANKTITYIFYK
jgi:hypothetical protein